MLIEPLTQADQIELGTFLLVSNGKQILSGKVKRILADIDGVEIVFNLRKNRYFNLGMYLAGQSWAKKVCVVRSGVA